MITIQYANYKLANSQFGYPLDCIRYQKG